MAEPYCLAMVLCDGYHQDPATGKYTLLGTFDAVVAPEFPAQTRLCIYFAVTDGIGDCTIYLQLVRADVSPIDASIDGVVPGRVFRMKTEKSFSSPLVVLEEAVELDFSLPEPGVYHCELWANNESLMSRRFIVQAVALDSENDKND